MAVKLPENYRRVLSSLSELLEQKVTGLIRLLQQEQKSPVITVRRNFSDREREEKIHRLTTLLEENHRFCKDFGLQPATYNEAQIYRSDLSLLWTILNDSYSKKLKGYGPLDPDTAASIDKEIAVLLEAVHDLEKPGDPEDKTP